jgi:hypothetical protein
VSELGGGCRLLAGHGAGFTVAALVERLLHAAHGTPAGQNPYARPLGSGTEGFHDIVTEEIGKKDKQLGAGWQLQGLFLVRGITAADMVADGNVMPFKQLGNIAQAIGPHNHSADKLRHRMLRNKKVR